MTLNEVFSLIALNKTQFPNWARDSTAAEMQLLAKTWQELFADIPGEIVLTAYKQALKYAEFPILPANIFNELRKIRRAGETPVEALWKQMLPIADQCGHLSYYFEYTDGPKKRADCKRLFDSLPPECREYIGNYSRLCDLGRMDDGERERFLFGRFKKFIEENREREYALSDSPKLAQMMGIKLLEG